MAEKAQKLTGGCQCGAVRYEFDLDDALTLYCCHCRECQRQSASAFGLSMLIPRNALAVTGYLRHWHRKTAGGGTNQARFCGDCGVRIYHQPSKMAEIVSLKAGTLDDTGTLRPVGHLWAKRARPWVIFEEGTLVYEGQPESYDDLIAAFAKQIAGTGTAN